MVVEFERYSLDLCIVVGIGNSNLGFVRLLYRHSSMDLVCMELVLFVELVVLLVLELTEPNRLHSIVLLILDYIDNSIDRHMEYHNLYHGMDLVHMDFVVDMLDSMVLVSVELVVQFGNHMYVLMCLEDICK